MDGAGNPIYDWTFSTSLTAGTATAPDKVLNVKLYDFLDAAIVMDYRGQNLPVSSGSPVVSSIEDISVFAPVYTNGVVTGFKNRHIQIGGFTRDVADLTPSTSGSVVVAIDIATTSSTQSGQLAQYASLAYIKAEQQYLQKLIVPLYAIVDGVIVTDFRRMPTSGMLEYFSSQGAT